MSIGLLIDVGQSLTKFNSELVSIDLDVTMDEAHEWSADVTSHPVENGSPITDHIQEQPDKLKITGMISDSAISDNVIKAYSEIDNSQFLTRAQTTFDLLRKLIKDKKTVTVYTKHKVYTDMALESLNIPRDASSGDAVNFTADFKHIRMVSTQTIEIPKGVSAKKTAKVDKSTQKKAEVPAKQGDKTPKALTQAEISGVASLLRFK